MCVRGRQQYNSIHIAQLVVSFHLFLLHFTVINKPRHLPPPSPHPSPPCAGHLWEREGGRGKKDRCSVSVCVCVHVAWSLSVWEWSHYCVSLSPPALLCTHTRVYLSTATFILHIHFWNGHRRLFSLFSPLLYPPTDSPIQFKDCRVIITQVCARDSTVQGAADYGNSAFRNERQLLYALNNIVK